MLHGPGAQSVGGYYGKAGMLATALSQWRELKRKRKSMGERNKG